MAKLDRKTKAQEKIDAAFGKALEARLLELGAVAGDHRIGVSGIFGGYTWKLETVAGPLLISCHGDWVATRFVDVDRAKEYVDHSYGSGELNPHSGKWNAHFENYHSVEQRLRTMESRLRKVLPAAA
jgi:hypothetical protein